MLNNNCKRVKMNSINPNNNMKLKYSINFYNYKKCILKIYFKK